MIENQDPDSFADTTFSNLSDYVPNAKEKKPILTNMTKLTPTELKVLYFALKESSKSKEAELYFQNYVTASLQGLAPGYGEKFSQR